MERVMVALEQATLYVMPHRPLRCEIPIEASAGSYFCATR